MTTQPRHGPEVEHPDAALMWLRIVATDARYAALLTLGTCTCWLRLRDLVPSETVFCVDRDGHVYAVEKRRLVHFWRHFDAQVVVDDGTVQPCTDIVAQYLHRAAERLSQEQT